MRWRADEKPSFDAFIDSHRTKLEILVARNGFLMVSLQLGPWFFNRMLCTLPSSLLIRVALGSSNHCKEEPLSIRPFTGKNINYEKQETKHE